MFKSIIILATLSLSVNAFAEDKIVTPADLPEKTQDKMYSMITDYNKCMMKGALKTDREQGDPRAKADEVLHICEPTLMGLKTFLNQNKVTPGLVDGFIVKMRSHGARMLLTHTMTNMAMQAAAADNAEKMKQK